MMDSLALSIHVGCTPQMAAGMDTNELYRTAVSYKAKLGPFATPRILNEYLKVRERGFTMSRLTYYCYGTTHIDLDMT